MEYKWGAEITIQELRELKELGKLKELGELGELKELRELRELRELCPQSVFVPQSNPITQHHCAKSIFDALLALQCAEKCPKECPKTSQELRNCPRVSELKKMSFLSGWKVREVCQDSRSVRNTSNKQPTKTPRTNNLQKHLEQTTYKNTYNKQPTKKSKEIIHQVIYKNTYNKQPTKNTYNKQPTTNIFKIYKRHYDL